MGLQSDQFGFAAIFIDWTNPLCQTEITPPSTASGFSYKNTSLQPLPTCTGAASQHRWEGEIEEREREREMESLLVG